MARISETFNVGDRADITPEKLLEVLEVMYKDLAVAINKKPEIYERKTDGQTTDTILSNGDININTSTLKVEMLTKRTDPSTTPSSVTPEVRWTQLS